MMENNKQGIDKEEDFCDTLPCNEVVAAYRVRRSFSDFKKFNVYAVDYMDSNLYPIVVDTNFDVAVKYANEYNKTNENITENDI